MAIDTGGRARLFQAAGTDDEAQVISVSVTAPKRTTSAAVVRPYAILDWGGNGITLSAEIDADGGFVVTVPCSSLMVTGVNAPIPATIGDTPATGSPINMGAFAAYGDLNRPTFLSRTLYLDHNDGFGTPQQFAVPAFASTLSVSRAPASGAFDVTLLDGGNNVVGDYPVAADAQFVGPITLSGDVATVEVTPPYDRTFVCRLVFGLEL